MSASLSSLQDNLNQEVVVCSLSTPATLLPSAQLSVIDEKESPRVTPSDAISCASAPLDHHPTASRWKLSAITKQDLIQGFLIVPPLAMVYIFGVVNHTSLEIIYELARDKGFPYQGHHLETLASCYYAAVVIFTIPSTLLCQRLGPRYWLPLLAVLGGIATLLLAYVHTFAAFLVLRILTGVAFAGVLPSIAAALLCFFGDKHAVLPLAIVVSGGPGLATLGAPIAERIFSDVARIGEAQGWQAIFLVEGILTIGAGTIAFAMMPHSLFHSAVTTKYKAALIHSHRSSSDRMTLKDMCSRHCLICGLVMTAAISVLGEKCAQLTPLKHTISPAAGPTFSNVHLWDFLPDTVASLSTIVCALVVYRCPKCLYSALLIASAFSLVGAIIFVVSNSTSRSGGEYAARILATSSTQCQIPLIYAILTQERVRKAAKGWQLALLLATTNVGFGIGGIIGVWQDQLPKMASATVVFICALCSLLLFCALTFVDRRMANLCR